MPTNKPVDVVIVGFGWTGAIMAIELAQAGLNVLALERGEDASTVPNWAYPKVVDEISQSARNGLLQNLSKSTVTIRHHKDDRALPYRQIGSFKPGTGVGGAGIHWSGVHSRVMPQELRLRSHITERYGARFIAEGMSLQDWGISYEELEPHFDRFEHVCGTSGKAGNIQGRTLEGGNPFEAPRSHEPFGYLSSLIDHVHEQRRVFRSVAGRRSGYVIQARLRETLRDLVERDLAGRVPNSNRDLAVRCVAGALFEALVLAAEKGRSIDPDALRRQLARLAE